MTGTLRFLPALAVGLAFADASIVALALPRVYTEFGTGIVAVSWVLTAYALAVTAASALVWIAAKRVRPIFLTTVGLALFAVASAWCGLSQSLHLLVTARCVQGVGAALLLSGSLAILHSIHPGDGNKLWNRAAGIGLAAGPAVGGLLTFAFDWRAIFLVQAPIALAAIALLRDPRTRAATNKTAPRHGDPFRLLASVFVFAGLVGALFLSVLLVVEVWRFGPLSGALIVSALPAAMLACSGLAARLPEILAGACGVLAMTAGLAALALLHATHPVWAVAALAICGAGFALAERALEGDEDGKPAPVVGDGAWVVAARHAGLVVGLLVIAPALSESMAFTLQDAPEAGTAVILDSSAEMRDKAAIATSLGDQLHEQPRGEFPDLEAAVSSAHVDTEVADTVGGDLSEQIEAMFTRAFRPAFSSAAGLTLFGLLVLPWRRGDGRRASRPALAGVAAIFLIAAGTLSTQVAMGAKNFGEYHPADPCAASAPSGPLLSYEAAAQRIGLSALNHAGCDLGLSREKVVLVLAGHGGSHAPQRDDPGFVAALSEGVSVAAEEAIASGDVPQWAIGELRELADEASLDTLLDHLGLQN